MRRGVLYSAYGGPAIAQCLQSIETLRRFHPEMKVKVFTDDPEPFVNKVSAISRLDSDKFGRLAKLSSFRLSPYEASLYIDADTRIRGSLLPFFLALEDGWEFVGTLSTNQKPETWLWHIPETERANVLDEIGFYSAIVQGGVWGFRQTPNVLAFGDLWLKLWRETGGTYEQAVMQQAFHRSSLKAYFLGRDFNGGNVIEHLYGQARRRDK